jgi:hypothetical protein
MYSLARIVRFPALESLERPLTLLPDSCRTGIKPKYAAHWLALSNWRLPTTISIRVAMTLPTPGMLSSNALFSLSCLWLLRCSSISFSSCLRSASSVPMICANDLKTACGAWLIPAFSCRLRSRCKSFSMLSKRATKAFKVRISRASGCA